MKKSLSLLFIMSLFLFAASPHCESDAMDAKWDRFLRAEKRMNQEIARMDASYEHLIVLLKECAKTLPECNEKVIQKTSVGSLQDLKKLGERPLLKYSASPAATEQLLLDPLKDVHANPLLQSPPVLPDLPRVPDFPSRPSLPERPEPPSSSRGPR